MFRNSTSRARQQVAGRLVAVVLCAVFSVCHAQDGTPTQRLLPLPARQNATPQQQMFLLQQLKMLVEGSQSKDETETSTAQDLLSKLRPEDLQALSQLFGGSPGQQPPNETDLPPDMLKALQSDPAARQQVQRLLEQFRRTGMLPQPGRDSGNGLLPPETRPSNVAPLPTGQSALDRKATGSRSAGSIDQLLKDLKSKSDRFPERQSENQSDPTDGGPSQTEGRQSQHSQSGSTDDGRNAINNSRPLPKSPSEWQQYLERLVQQQRGQHIDPDSFDRPVNNRRQSTGPAGERQDRTVQQQYSDASSTVAELLQQLKPADADELTRFLEDQQRKHQNNGEPNGEQPQSPHADASSTTTDVAKDALKKKGLTGALRDLYRNAREQAVNGVAASGDNTGGGNGNGVAAEIEGALLKAVDGIRRDVIEMAQDGRIGFRPQTQNTAGPDETAGRLEARSEQQPSTLQSLGQSAQNLFKEMTKKTEPSTSNDEIPGLTPVDTGVSLPNSGSPLTMVLIGVVILGILAAWMLRQPSLTQQQAAALKELTEGRLATRDDIVRAFHAVALLPEHAAQPWWNHRMAAERVATAKPETSDAVVLLTKLYERARYLPEDEALSDAELNAARNALRRWRR